MEKEAHAQVRFLWRTFSHSEVEFSKVHVLIAVHDSVRRLKRKRRKMRQRSKWGVPVPAVWAANQPGEDSSTSWTRVWSLIADWSSAAGQEASELLLDVCCFSGTFWTRFYQFLNFLSFVFLFILWLKVLVNKVLMALFLLLMLRDFIWVLFALKDTYVLYPGKPVFKIKNWNNTNCCNSNAEKY